MVDRESHPSIFLAVAEQLMRMDPGRSLTPMEIWDGGRSRGLFPDTLNGFTPWQTIKSKLSVEIRKNGNKSKFIRTSPGRFSLRNQLGQRQPFEAIPWRPPSSSERVVALKADVFKLNRRHQGISTNTKSLLKQIADERNVVILDRPFAETTEQYKQLLTYVIVRRGDSLLCFTRGAYNRAPDFLRGARCIGFGGHVDATDLNILDKTGTGLEVCVLRELSEELNLPPSDRDRLFHGVGLELLGFLNDDSSSVGRKHLAAIYSYNVSDSKDWDQPVRGEESIRQLHWISPGTDADIHLHEFEYWSQLVLRKFFKLASATTSTFKIRRLNRIRRHKYACLVGQIGSGKTAAASVFVDDFGYQAVNTGRVLASLLDVPPIPQTSRATFQRLAQQYISQKGGPARLAQGIYESCIGDGPFLIDGIRYPETLARLREIAGAAQVAVVYIQTPPDVAYKFYRLRENPTASILDYLDIRDAPSESRIPEMLSDADAVIYNWYGAEHYRRVVKSILDSTGSNFGVK